MTVPPLSPAGALSLAGLLFFLSVPLASSAEGPENTSAISPSTATPVSTLASTPHPS